MSLGGWRYRTKCPFFCQQDDLQTIHGRRNTLPPSTLPHSLTSLPQTHSHLCEKPRHASEGYALFIIHYKSTAERDCTDMSNAQGETFQVHINKSVNSQYNKCNLVSLPFEQFLYMHKNTHIGKGWYPVSCHFALPFFKGTWGWTMTGDSMFCL